MIVIGRARQHWSQAGAQRRLLGTFLVAVVLTVLLVALYGRLTGSGVASGEASVEEGRRQFTANCRVCHGDVGDRIPTAPLNSRDFLDSRGDATLVSVIYEGKGVMPAWSRERGGPLTEEQIRFVLAYLNAAAGRTSPALHGSAGKALFQQHCARCHGEAGDRVPIAPLLVKAFLDSRTDAQLLEVIDQGKGVMPPRGQAHGGPLDDQQVKEVVSYLRYNAEFRLAVLARRGRELYLANCLACHGERGNRVAKVALAAPEYLQKLGDGGLIAAIGEGKGTMPGFSRAKGGFLDLPEVSALLTYLKTWASLPAGSALVGPEGPSEGRAVFQKNCAACHGDMGDKVPGILLKTQEFLGSRSDDELARAVGQGNTRGMPAFGQAFGGPLSDPDVGRLVEYLRSVATTSAAGAGAGPDSARGVLAPAGPGTEAPGAGRGNELFSKTCTACHGDTADKVPTARLADGAWLQQRGDAALAQSIARGKGPMPAFGKERGGSLGPEEITAILDFLKSGAGGGAAPAASGGTPPVRSEGAPTPASGGAAAPAPPAAGDGALVARGAEIFGANCVVCHGASRDKVPAARLTDPTWLQRRGDKVLAESITRGKGPMPALGQEKGGPLSAEEIAAAVAYLKSAAGTR